MGAGPASRDGRTRGGAPPRAGRGALVGAAGLAVVGAAALAAVLLSQSGSVGAVTGGGDAGLVLERQRTVPLDPRVRRVAEAWILSAVNRSDLAAAYELTHADLRGAMSRREWETGNIPVVPYPVTEIGPESWRVDTSLEGEALLEVALTSSDPSTAPVVFLIGLVKAQGRWLVHYWSPRGRMSMP